MLKRVPSLEKVVDDVLKAVDLILTKVLDEVSSVIQIPFHGPYDCLN